MPCEVANGPPSSGSCCAVSKPKSQFVICCQRLLRYYSVLLLNEAQFGSLAELLEKAACGKTPFAEDCIFEKFCQVPDYCIYLAANFFWQDFSKKSAGLDTASFCTFSLM